MRMNRFTAAVVVVIVVVMRSAVAAVPPPMISTLDTLNGTRAPVQPATSLSLGSTNVAFETSTFADISIIGSAPIGQHGDAAGFEMWVCYTLSNEKQRLWLTSGELGGHEYIDGAVAQLLPSGTPATTDCPELPSRYRPVHLDFGVWIGTLIQELTRHFGQPTQCRDGSLYFAYSGKDGEYDVTDTLIVRLVNNRVVALRANHITTN